MNGSSRRADGRSLDIEVLLVDGLLVSGPVIGILAVQFLSASGTKTALTHEAGALTALSLFGHAFVHFSAADLVWNALGYVVLVLLAYALAVWVGERQWFLLSLLSVLLVVPVVSAGVDHLLFARLFDWSVSIRGFSGVVAGVVGLVVVLYLGAIRRRYGPLATLAVGTLGFAWLGTIITVIYPSMPVYPAVFGLLVALSLVLTVAGRRTAWSPGAIRRGRLAVATLAGTVVAIAFTASTVLLFPVDPFGVGPVTNVYSHAVGVSVGLVGGIWGHRYWTHLDWI